MKRLSLVLVLAMLTFAACKHKKPATKRPAPKSKGLPSVALKTKKLKKYPGLFTIYEDTTNGKAYMQVNANQLGKDFIYFSYTENGVVQAGHFRGAYRDNQVFKVRKRYNYIEFVKENHRFYFDSTSALSKSKDANISPSILISESLVAKTKDSLYLISADKIFKSEQLSRIKPPSLPIPGAMFRFKLGRLNPKKTHYQKIRNYPENTDLVVEYVYDNPAAFISGGAEVADPRSVSIQVQHSFIELPESDFEVRYDDPRVGYFMTQQEDMTSYSVTPYRDKIHKWNLKKKNPDAALSEPVKPITWWIENTTPKKYRAAIKKAGETWNLAFEKAGFKNAVVIKEQPDTAEWDAGDIRYNVLRWTSSPRPPFGGYGPSFVNPLTGEILGADIMLEFVFLTGRMNSYDILTTESLEISDWDEELKEHQTPDHLKSCSIGNHMHHNIQLGMTNLMANNASPAEKDEFVESAVYYLILHEMGHTMGLMHNMKASNLWMPEDIHNKAKTQSKGLIGSVMDYPAININPDHAKQGDYYTTKPGPYDMWAIEYAYSPGLEDAGAEEKRLNKILSRSSEHDLFFGNDADDMRSPGKGMDPRIMIFDISGDAVNYSGDRIAMLKKNMSVLKDRFTEEGKGYQHFRNAYYTMQKEIFNAGQVISRYIGGVYVERNMVGQTGAKKPYTPVPEDYQKEAMGQLSKQLFAPDAFDAPENFYNYLQAQRRGFNFFSNAEDPKIHDMALRIQAASLVHILHYRTLKRVTNSSLYGNTYSVMDIMNDLEKAIFDADIKGSCNTFRINLQNYYVQKLIQVSGLKSSRSSYDNISQTAAFGSLQRIKNKLNSNKSRGDSITQAHRAYLIHLIDKAMEK